MEQRERIKKNLIDFCNHIEKFSKKNNIDNTMGFQLLLAKMLNSKSFPIVNEPGSKFKESKNLGKFITHRTSLNTFSKNKWKNKSVEIPFVMRFHNSNLRDEISKDLLKEVSINTINPNGCHYVADRLSVKFPKKVVSLRTKFSLPHYGIDKTILEHLGKGIHEVKTNRGVSSIFDDGKLWINHSINLIKDENEYKRLLKDIDDGFETNVVMKDRNPKLYDLIGDGVCVDYDLVGFRNSGLYDTLQYKGLETFSFENFDEEELSLVEDWLDYEFISLLLSSHGDFYHYLIDDDNYFTEYMEVIEELNTEIGNKYLKYLMSKTIQDKLNKLVEDVGNKFGLDGVKHTIKQYSGELETDEWEQLVEMEKLSLSNRKKGIKEYRLKMEQLFHLPSEELEPSKNKLREIRKNTLLPLLEDRFDFNSGMIVKPTKNISNSQAIELARRINLM